MSNCFNGAALYTKDEISKALDAYDKAVKVREDFIDNKVKLAEGKFIPSWWDKLHKIKTLKDKYRRWLHGGSFRWTSYHGWCNDNNLLDFSEEDGAWLEELSLYEYTYTKFNQWVYTNISEEVKDLYNGGKDCYLNPDQAHFVNKFKNYEEN